jgi:hypothetical protein
MKELICPKCKRICPLTFGFIYDDDNNLICQNCDGVIFATTQQAEVKIKRIDWCKKEVLGIKKGIGEIPFEKNMRQDHFGSYCGLC